MDLRFKRRQLFNNLRSKTKFNNLGYLFFPSHTNDERCHVQGRQRETDNIYLRLA